MEGKKIICSFSGGRTSAFMAAMLKAQGVCDTFLFANTSKEKEETFIFVNECDKTFGLNVVWLEAVINPEKGKGTRHRVVSFDTALRNGEMFEEGAKKYGLPNVNNPWCTRELKQATMHSWVRENIKEDYVFAIGIRPDEAHRIKKDSKFIYPLLDFPGLDSRFIRNWWAKQPFDLQLKDYEGNCDLCFKKSLRKRMTLISGNEHIADFWGDLELQHGEGGKYLLDMRAALSIEEIKQRTKRPFVKAIDLAELNNKAPGLFDEKMDWERDCFCKSS